jgi:hypothetical protein
MIHYCLIIVFLKTNDYFALVFFLLSFYLKMQIILANIIYYPNFLD